MALTAAAELPQCDVGDGCTTRAWYSPLTEDTQWETWCDDGFFHSGILQGDVECVLCPC